MASRHARYAPVAEYQPLHVNAAGTLLPVGQCVSTTIAGALTAGSNVVITPASMANIKSGMYLTLVNGATYENVLVKLINATAFTVDLVNSYAANTQVFSRRGIYLGTVTINTVGSADNIKLYNGHPNLQPDPGVLIASITPGSADKTFNCACDKGLYYTVSGTTVGDYTINFLDQAV